MSEQSKPAGEWTVVPCALHFNIMCGDALIYEGVTSEKQGNHLVNAHKAALAAKDEYIAEIRTTTYSDLEQQLAAEREKREREMANYETLCNDLRQQLAAEREKMQTLVDALRKAGVECAGGHYVVAERIINAALAKVLK